MITRTTQFPDGKGKTEDVPEADVGSGIANLVHTVAYRRLVIEKVDGTVVEYRRAEEGALDLSPEELLAEHGIRGAKPPPPSRRGLQEALERAFREAEIEGWISITGGGPDDLALVAIDQVRQVLEPSMLVMAAAGLVFESRRWPDEDKEFMLRCLEHLRSCVALMRREDFRDGTH